MQKPLINMCTIWMASAAMYFLIDSNYEMTTMCVSLVVLSRVESLILLTKEKDK
jgi:hypothetical protein